ncbi:hypothetical protein PO124_00945 [Bacillus licheniformis]|nr:hypothetical protein [Bacillus licheniformis]
MAADIYRPAAIKQLETLGKQLDMPVFHWVTRSVRWRLPSRPSKRRKKIITTTFSSIRRDAFILMKS